MTDGWDERTEAIPGTKGDKSFEIELDFAEDSDAVPETVQLARPSVVVFEPTHIGLADALGKMGFAVRMGSTGVDVMSVVARDPPGAVLCAPAQDAERRRLLAAALRLRFPHIPVIYVSTHAGQEDAVLGAIREGARAVLAWPLPQPSEVMRVLGPYMNRPATDTGLQRRAVGTDTATTPRSLGESVDATTLAPRPKAAPRAPASSEDDAFQEAETIVTPSLPTHPPVVEARSGPPPTLLPASRAPAPQRVPSRVLGFADEPETQPNMRPAADAVAEAMAQRRGEIGDLLAAISPFLWSLEDASRWASELGQQGDPAAQSHARTLTLLAKILAQLQARIDDIGA